MTDDRKGENSSPYVEIANNLKERERIARISAHAYLTSSRILENKMSWILVISLVASLLLAGTSIILISYPLGQNQTVTTIIAFLALGFSIFGVSDRLFGWSAKKADYDLGFRTWNRYLRESQWFRKNELPMLSTNEARIRAERFQCLYDSCLGTLPPNGLNERAFLRCKQELNKAMQISRMLDDDPSIDLFKEWKKTK
ncbi:MAG TPA: hypothetical protein O0Y06_07640 [Methanocorpusculum sp.]|nr:hypothetical protein [Methanocorpusculum sp.]HJK80758.1 hypothetical protein [Methanocorpusculum sp.]